MLIDFSAHSTWDNCPGEWYEKYVNRRRKRWPPGPRKDALCLGSLVHEGLRIWQEQHLIQIPGQVIEEMTPDKETYDLALELVYGYTQAYPQERWELIRCEEPIRFPLVPREQYWCQADHQSLSICTHSYEPEHYEFPGLEGLAKIDAYFYVPELTTIESGIVGLDLTLEPGWWIHEYKTKSPFIPTGIYMQGWEMGMQASYQMLALEHHLSQIAKGETGKFFLGNDDNQQVLNHNVQGVLINVLEKPRRTTPKRKCLTCQEYYEFATWLPTGTGEYACQICGSRQKLQPLKENVPSSPPSYYRFAVHRTKQELEWARIQIIQTGEAMLAMERDGLFSHPWNTKNCVNQQWKRECAYFSSHKNFTPTEDNPDFEPVPDYRGLTTIEGDSQ